MPGNDSARLEPLLASAALRLFALVVIAWGLSGVFLTDFWLHGALTLHLPAFGPLERGTVVNEFRFLEARELGVGIFALALHREILTSRKHNLTFLAVVFAAPAARLFSCLVDGPPKPLWLAFGASELVMGIALLVLTRSARRIKAAASPP